MDAISRALSGWAGKMVPFRDGTLRVFGLRAMSPADVATGALTTVNLVSLVPRPLPPTLDPPPYRVRVEAERNWTIQTTDINTASADQRHVQKVALTGYTATWSSVVVLAAYRRPNDFAPITGSLLNIADAISVAIDMGALWGVRRRLYDATVPASLGFSLNISDIVSLRYPMDNLVSGQLGRVVGWQFRSTDQTVTFQVLV